MQCGERRWAPLNHSRSGAAYFHYQRSLFSLWSQREPSGQLELRPSQTPCPGPLSPHNGPPFLEAETGLRRSDTSGLLIPTRDPGDQGRQESARLGCTRGSRGTAREESPPFLGRSSGHSGVRTTPITALLHGYSQWAGVQDRGGPRLSSRPHREVCSPQPPPPTPRDTESSHPAGTWP